MEIFQLTVTTVPPRWREEQRREAEEKSLGNHGSSGLGPHLLRRPSRLVPRC